MIGKESGSLPRLGLLGSESCCAPLFTDSKTIIAGPVPWNYSSRLPSAVSTCISVTRLLVGSGSAALP